MIEFLSKTFYYLSTVPDFIILLSNFVVGAFFPQLIFGISSSEEEKGRLIGCLFLILGFLVINIVLPYSPIGFGGPSFLSIVPSFIIFSALTAILVYVLREFSETEEAGKRFLFYMLCIFDSFIFMFPLNFLAGGINGLIFGGIAQLLMGVAAAVPQGIGLFMEFPTVCLVFILTLLYGEISGWISEKLGILLVACIAVVIIISLILTHALEAPKVTYLFLVLLIIANFTALPYIFSFLNLPGEVVYKVRTGTEEAAKRLEVWYKYLEMYRKMKGNETLRRLFGMVSYERPPPGEWVIYVDKEVELKINSVFNDYRSEKKRLNITVYGTVRNPFEFPVKIRSLEMEVKDIEAPIEGVLTPLKITPRTICTPEGGFQLSAGEERAIECTATLDGIDSDAYSEVFYTVSLKASYLIAAASTQEITILGEEEYKSRLRWGTLKEEEPKSYSSWGPLLCVVKETKYQKSPIPARDNQVSLAFSMYTIYGAGSGRVKKMYGYILVLPQKVGNSEIEVPSKGLDSGCGRGVTSQIHELISELKDITKEEAIIYGYSLYNLDTFKKELEDLGWQMVSCKINVGEYKADPTQRGEVKQIKVNIKNIGDSDVIILRPVAYFVYEYESIASKVGKAILT